MNKKELEICKEIISRRDSIRFSNNSWLRQCWWNKRSSNFISLQKIWLYQKEPNLKDYIDGRKNLIHIPNYCEDTWEKISRARIKQYLTDYE